MNIHRISLNFMLWHEKMWLTQWSCSWITTQKITCYEIHWKTAQTLLFCIHFLRCTVLHPFQLSFWPRNAALLLKKISKYNFQKNSDVPWAFWHEHIEMTDGSYCAYNGDFSTTEEGIRSVFWAQIFVFHLWRNRLSNSRRTIFRRSGELQPISIIGSIYIYIYRLLEFRSLSGFI